VKEAIGHGAALHGLRARTHTEQKKERVAGWRIPAPDAPSLLFLLSLLSDPCESVRPAGAGTPVRV